MFIIIKNFICQKNLQKETNGENAFSDLDEYGILLKNNELIKTKLDNLQFHNSKLRAQLNNFETEENSNNLINTPLKNKRKSKPESNDDQIAKNGLFLMMVSQASIIENFLNEKVL